MIQLIYTSVARVPLSGTEISRILLKARVNNALEEITGVLLYRSDSFMQLIEGEDQAVDSLFAKILADSRHCGVQVLRRAQVTERIFPNWYMGFVHLEKGRADEPAGISDYFEKKGKPTPQAGEAAMKLLSDFRYGNWRRHVDCGYAPAVAR